MDLTAIAATLDPSKGQQIIVETFISSGQPRPYADSVSVSEFRAFWYNSYTGEMSQREGNSLLSTIENKYRHVRRERGTDYATAFDSYISSIELCANDTAVSVTWVTPFCD